TLKKLFACAIVPGENAHLNQLRKELEKYFAGDLKQFSVPLVYPGTPFQERVWNELLRIPYGHTRSYEDVARRIGSADAHRAVGHANGRIESPSSSPAIGLLIRTGSSVATEVACEENTIFSILRKSSWPRISRITRKASRRSRFRPRSRRLLLISRFDLTVAAVIGAVNKLESSVIPVIPLLAVMQGGESPYSNFFTAPSLTAAGPMPSPCWSRGSPRPRSVDRTGSECSRRSAS